MRAPKSLALPHIGDVDELLFADARVRLLLSERQWKWRRSHSELNAVRLELAKGVQRVTENRGPDRRPIELDHSMDSTSSSTPARDPRDLPDLDMRT